jgi:hypothetical protein
MKLKDDSVEIKMKLSVKSMVSSELSWTKMPDKDSAISHLSERVESNRETMEELADFNKDRWDDILQSKVLGKEYGKKRVFDEIENYFELEDSERDWIEERIEIYRKMRLEEMDFERAERVVKHGRDPNQLKIGENVE